MDARLLTAIISTSAFSAALTLALNRLFDRRRRHKQAKGYLRGIQLEIAYAQECADAYVTDVDNGHPVWAPNYRAVTEFTRLQVPWLAAEHYLQVDEANQLFRFYTRATEVNRSLDALAEMISAPGYRVPVLPTGDTREEQETSRCHAKSSNLLGRVPDQIVGSTPKAWDATVSALARIGWISRLTRALK
jgi:hypothetical protein